jgi:hypothetical protein
MSTWMSGRPMRPSSTLERVIWLWVHLACLVLLSGVGGYVWGGEPLRYMVLLATLWSVNVLALALWLHRGR